MDLGDNNLTGEIPNWIGSLSELSILVLKANHFEGRIPFQLCHLGSLSIMDLSHNNLSGPIPHCLSNIFASKVTDEKSLVLEQLLVVPLTKWTSSLLYVVRTKLILPGYYDSHLERHSISDGEEEVEFTTKSMSYPYKGDILNLMSGIDLSCNQFSGEIPLGLGNLSHIHALNVSHNNLTGSIPASFSNLRQIESLDLSYNKLNGRIPPQLIELNSLAVFSVAYNNLSGKVPDKAQFTTFNESSYEGNRFLCGPPLHNNFIESGSQPPTSNGFDNDEGEDGFVDMETFSVSFVVTYITVLLAIAIILYINAYWRRAWFHLVERSITSSYYFVVDNFSNLFSFRNK